MYIIIPAIPFPLKRKLCCLCVWCMRLYMNFLKVSWEDTHQMVKMATSGECQGAGMLSFYNLIDFLYHLILLQV